jgi:hypothetical protein
LKAIPRNPAFTSFRSSFPCHEPTAFSWRTRYATVIKGTRTPAKATIYTGKTVALKPAHEDPAYAHHFDGAKDEEVILH